MALYLKTSGMLSTGMKNTMEKERRCLKCREFFTSTGDRTCSTCQEKNAKYGVNVSF